MTNFKKHKESTQTLPSPIESWFAKIGIGIGVVGSLSWIMLYYDITIDNDWPARLRLQFFLVGFLLISLGIIMSWIGFRRARKKVDKRISGD